MSTFTSNFKDWKLFWRAVVKMWGKEHGLNIRLLWKLSPLMTLIGIIGILALNQPWKSVCWALFGIGIFDLLASLLFVFPYIKWKQDTDKLKEEIQKLAPLVELETQQRGHEGDWLHLVVEAIVLGKRMNQAENEVVVKFQIDSSLVYDFQPYRMWVSPILGGLVPAESQLEIRQPPNLLRGKRSQLPSMTITVKDERLLELVKNARQGADVPKSLKVEIQLRSSESPIVVLRSENVYSDRVNDMS